MEGGRVVLADTLFHHHWAVFHLRLSTWCCGMGVEGGPELPELVSYSRAVTHLIFCLHCTDCRDQCAWYSCPTQLPCSYVGCSVEFMVSGPGSRGLGLRGGGTLEGKQLLLSRQARWSPEERQQNEQAGRKRRPGASRPGVTEPSQTVFLCPTTWPHTLFIPTQPVPTVQPG